MFVCMYICKRSHYEVIFPTQLVYETNSPVLILGIKSGDCGNPLVMWESLHGSSLQMTGSARSNTEYMFVLNM